MYHCENSGNSQHGENMKSIILGLLASLVLIGCSSDTQAQNVEAKLVVQKELASITLNDQFEKQHTMASDTKTVIFAFSKDMGHMCNDFFATKDASYLQNNKAIFIADVSSAPSLIRSMFILPGLKDFKHTVLVLDDKSIAAPFRASQDTEKTVVVSLEGNTIISIDSATTPNQLSALIER